MLGTDTLYSRRHLPHLENGGKTYFDTWCTIDREILPDAARDIALACAVHDHQITYFLWCAVVMPDHVHAVFTPYEGWLMTKIHKWVKGNSSRLINKACGRRGNLWQEESFDRILRSDEDAYRKSEYVCENPVRAGLVSSTDEYRWIWREWIEGKGGQTMLHIPSRRT
jgi:REP element-mobilizing transposase RayT